MIIFKKFDSKNNCIIEAHGDPRFLNLPRDQRNISNLLGKYISYLHRPETEGPAFIERVRIRQATAFGLSPGEVLNERYYCNGKLHRDNGPAYVEYSHTNLRKVEYYYKNDVNFNDSGPIQILYYRDNTQRYYYKNKDYNFMSEILLNTKEEIQNYLILK